MQKHKVYSAQLVLGFLNHFYDFILYNSYSYLEFYF